MNSRTRLWLLVYIMMVLFGLLVGFSVGAQQKQPSPKRVHEIQEALREHGFKPGETWRDTQEACRDIQREHHWQIHFAPDARVLILIGLGNKYSDLEVLMQGSNHLDEAQNGKN